jgi:hypothetical protein
LGFVGKLWGTGFRSLYRRLRLQSANLMRLLIKTCIAIFDSAINRSECIRVSKTLSLEVCGAPFAGLQNSRRGTPNENSSLDSRFSACSVGLPGNCRAACAAASSCNLPSLVCRRFETGPRPTSRAGHTRRLTPKGASAPAWLPPDPERVARPGSAQQSIRSCSEFDQRT